MEKKIKNCETCTHNVNLEEKFCGIDPSKIVFEHVTGNIQFGMGFENIIFNEQKYKLVDCSGYGEKNVCEFVSINQDDCIMLVGGKNIGIEKCDVEYFEDHYKKLGYKIEKKVGYKIEKRDWR